MLLNPQEISSPMSGVIDSSTFSTAETTPDIRKSPETGRVIQLQPIPLAAGAWHQQNSSIAGNQQCINIYIYINIQNYPSYAFKKKCSRPRFWQRRHQDTKRMTSIGVRGFQRCATCWGLSSSELLELSFWRWREDGRMGWVEFTAMFWRIKLMGGWW